MPLPLHIKYTPRDSFTVAKLAIVSLKVIAFYPCDSCSRLIASMENCLIVVLLSVSCNIFLPGMTKECETWKGLSKLWTSSSNERQMPLLRSSTSYEKTLPFSLYPPKTNRNSSLLLKILLMFSEVTVLLWGRMGGEHAIEESCRLLLFVG